MSDLQFTMTLAGGTIIGALAVYLIRRWLQSLNWKRAKGNVEV